MSGGAGDSGSPRAYIKNVINEQEAEQLAQANGRVSFGVTAVARVVQVMQSLYPVAVTPSSYARVEQNMSGHDWHVDTGDSDHMPWCAASASVLLTKPTEFEGGGFQFDAPFDEHAAHYCNAIIYTSDQIHRVLPHTGNRRVLLIFLGAENGK